MIQNYLNKINNKYKKKNKIKSKEQKMMIKNKHKKQNKS